MFLRWSKDRFAEQHLEGDCRNVDLLKVECLGVENGNGARVLRVHHVESVSDGTLRIYLDISKETE